MTTNELRHIDYDAVRERAQALRREALSEMLGSAIAWLARLPAKFSGRAQAQVRASALCADC
jgi:hypothetical protein